MLRTTRRLLLVPPLLVPLALPLGLTGCEREVATEAPVRPPVVLDEETITRLIDAMHSLQDLSRTHPYVREQGLEVIPMFFGVTAVLGDAADAVVKRHGFLDAEDFESKLAWTREALMQLQFEGRHGFDGDAQLYRLRGRKTDLEARLKELEKDSELSDDTRRLMQAEVRMQIEAIDDRMLDVNDFADTMEDRYEVLPAENLASVRAHLDEILALVAPDGTFVTTPPGAAAGGGAGADGGG